MSKLKKGDNFVKAVEEHKAEFKKEAETLVKNVFPKKITELNKLLNDERLALHRMSKVCQETSIPIPDPSVTNNQTNDAEEDEPPAKRKRHGYFANKELFPNGLEKTNANLTELHELLKPHILDLIEHSAHIKMWITYLMPKIEDGNNFGVEVQEGAVLKSTVIEMKATSHLNAASKFYTTRAEAVRKIAKYPHVEDERKILAELDQTEFVRIRNVCSNLRNLYANLHDLIIKNYDKIVKPKSYQSQTMF